MNDKTLKYLTYIIVVVAFFGLYNYVEYVNARKEDSMQKQYASVAQKMKKEFASVLRQKQRSTSAIAISLARDKELVYITRTNKFPKRYFQSLIEDFRNNTPYKNIWIQVVNKDAKVLYRSWDTKKGDYLCKTRADVRAVLKEKKVLYGVNVDKYTIALHSIAPILYGGELIGAIDVISHFNSIAKELKKEKIESVVILDKSYEKVLKYPYTERRLQDYYIANFNVEKESLKYLQTLDIKSLLHKAFIIDEHFLLSSYPIYTADQKTVGYAILMKKKEDISLDKLEYTYLKLYAIGFGALGFILVLLNIFLYHRNQKQKVYYKSIIDLATNVVLVFKGDKLIDANERFFEFVKEFESIDDFNEKHASIGDFFVKEEGYLYDGLNDQNWLDYLLTHNATYQKAKIKYGGKVMYFTLSAAVISKSENIVSIVFTDITQEENYKIELEHLSITDTLTNIYNRRYFNQKLTEDVVLASRYKIPLSMIMFDIDHFKKVNDTYGHAVGDKVLIEYTKLIKDNLRESDTFCRTGGEEFSIILPYTTREDAAAIAEKLREKVQEAKVVLPITMSFGVTGYILGESEEAFLIRVDEALYEAKENGRNRVVVQ